jgi:endoglucanase
MPGKKVKLKEKSENSANIHTRGDRIVALRISLIALVVSLAACGGGSSQAGSGSSTGSLSPVGAVTVSGPQFLRDGQPWVPKGLVSVAFNAAPAIRQGLFLTAYNDLTPTELTAMKTWGADTVRFMVAQPALDPQSSLYDSTFISDVQRGVTEARGAGLNVIVTVQDESGTGETTPMALPNVGTGRVWKLLAPIFANDPGIMFEIMNEPQPSPSTANWQAWASAMNAMVAIIRGSGAKNVLIADGLGFAEYLTGAPALADPINQVAYADHPYPHSATDQTTTGWDTKFGNFAASTNAPVIITEWSDENEPNNVFAYCDGNTPQAALNFLTYLQSKHIALIGLGYDLPNQPSVPRDGRIMLDFDGTPSTLANGASCDDADFGPGTVVQNYFRTGNVPSQLE